MIVYQATGGYTQSRIGTADPRSVAHLRTASSVLFPEVLGRSTLIGPLAQAETLSVRNMLAPGGAPGAGGGGDESVQFAGRTRSRPGGAPGAGGRSARRSPRRGHRRKPIELYKFRDVRHQSHDTLLRSLTHCRYDRLHIAFRDDTFGRRGTGPDYLPSYRILQFG